MTVFNIDEDKQGAWFDMEGGGRVQLRTLTFDDWDEIKKQTVRKGLPEYPKLDGKYQRFQPEIVNDSLQIEMIWDKTILAWESLFDRNKQPIPCTREMKRALMLMRDDSFRNFYQEKMNILLEVDKEQAEASEKNL